MGLGSFDADKPVKLAAELGHRRGDFGRLLGESGQHALRHLRFAPDQLQTRNDERQVVVDVMPHDPKLLFEVGHLFRR